MEFKTDDESLRTRIVGLVLMCAGIALCYADYYMRNNSDYFYPMLSFLAPLLVAIAIICVVETPKIPIEKLSFFGWVCISIGAFFGIWNAVL